MKKSKRQLEIEARMAADPIAQALGRTDIDYSSDDLPTAPRMAAAGEAHFDDRSVDPRLVPAHWLNDVKFFDHIQGTSSVCTWQCAVCFQRWDSNAKLPCPRCRPNWKDELLTAPRIPLVEPPSPKMSCPHCQKPIGPFEGECTGWHPDFKCDCGFEASGTEWRFCPMCGKVRPTEIFNDGVIQGRK